jgi:uncharacterized protein YerC
MINSTENPRHVKPRTEVCDQLALAAGHIYEALRLAEHGDIRTMMGETAHIINTLTTLVSDTHKARRFRIVKRHEEGNTYRKMADEIGISYQRVAQIAKGNK